jgi:hypothetical protein
MTDSMADTRKPFNIYALTVLTVYISYVHGEFISRKIETLFLTVSKCQPKSRGAE